MSEVSVEERVEGTGSPPEMTLALIKPEAVKFQDSIENIILENGFTILSKRTVQLTPEQVADFYRDHIEEPYFANLVVHLANTSIIALCISKNNAIQEWLKLIGPTSVTEAQASCPDSIRARYGLSAGGNYSNAVHGSQDHSAAVREIHFFFPTMVVGPILGGGQIEEYLQGHVNPTLLEGLSQLCKEKPVDPIVWLADWLLTHNPNSPETLPSNMGAMVDTNIHSHATSITESIQS